MALKVVSHPSSSLTTKRHYKKDKWGTTFIKETQIKFQSFYLRNTTQIFCKQKKASRSFIDWYNNFASSQLFKVRINISEANSSNRILFWPHCAADCTRKGFRNSLTFRRRGRCSCCSGVWMNWFMKWLTYDLWPHSLSVPAGRQWLAWAARTFREPAAQYLGR